MKPHWGMWWAIIIRVLKSSNSCSIFISLHQLFHSALVHNGKH